VSRPATIPRNSFPLLQDRYAWALSYEAPTTMVVAERLREFRQHYCAPATRQKPTIRERFRALAAEWHEATFHLSAPTSMAMHPAYQAIIGLGPNAVPLILAELEKAPDHWFWALKALTNEDPVPPTDRGRVLAMREAWLTWGQNSGYRW
jgi:hypothetical protein